MMANVRRALMALSFSDMSPPMAPRIMPVNEARRLLKWEF